MSQKLSEKYPAGPSLDALVAEKVKHWKLVPVPGLPVQIYKTSSDGLQHYYQPSFMPSQFGPDFEALMKEVNGWGKSIAFATNNGGWMCRVSGGWYAKAPTMPHAFCLALLLDYKAISYKDCEYDIWEDDEG